MCALLALAWMVGLVNAAWANEAMRVEFSAYPNLPLAFERNQGQADERVKYLARGTGFDAFFMADTARILKRDGMRASAVDITVHPGS